VCECLAGEDVLEERKVCVVLELLGLGCVDYWYLYTSRKGGVVVALDRTGDGDYQHVTGIHYITFVIWDVPVEDSFTTETI
jgi:hypothetical protein